VATRQRHPRPPLVGVDVGAVDEDAVAARQGRRRRRHALLPAAGPPIGNGVLIDAHPAPASTCPRLLLLLLGSGLVCPLLCSGALD
jgi:hypothetical protein